MRKKDYLKPATMVVCTKFEEPFMAPSIGTGDPKQGGDPATPKDNNTVENPFNNAKVQPWSHEE